MRERGRGRSRSERARAASAEVIAAIVALDVVGAKQSVIARAVGVSQAHVSKVLSARGGAVTTTTPTEKKACIDCGSKKPLDAFYRVHKDSEHRQSRCKPCDNRKRGGNFKRGVSDHEVVVTRQADGSLSMSRVARPGASP
jgi:hypothetical protein